MSGKRAGFRAMGRVNSVAVGAAICAVLQVAGAQAQTQTEPPKVRQILMPGAPVAPVAAPVKAPTPVAAPAAPAVTAQANPPAASGPSSVEETYDDWKVICRQAVAQAAAGSPPASRSCSVVQQQFDEKSRQRLLAVEFVRPSADKADGMAVLPFGIALERGAVLQLDAQPPAPALRFRTCLPAGCVLPLSFDAKALPTLRKGQVMMVKLVADGGADMAFKISLKGLGPALDRAVALAK